MLPRRWFNVDIAQCALEGWPPPLSRGHIHKDVKIKLRERFNSLWGNQRLTHGRNSRPTLQSGQVERGRVVQLSPDVRRSSLQRITNTPTTPNRIIDYLAPESPMNVDDDLLLELLFKIWRHLMDTNYFTIVFNFLKNFIIYLGIELNLVIIWHCIINWIW